MTLDQYNEAVKGIFSELQRIAEQTATQALACAAHPANPAFVAIMKRQWELIQKMTQLNVEMLLGINKP
ncbi:MAG: hypothetical protein ACREBW_01065 [Candidatus Micrarchaeaceae archaeon]